MANNAPTPKGPNDVNSQHVQHCQTKFRKALLKGDHVMCRQLMEQGVNINTQDIDGCTTLMLASEAGNMKIVRILVWS